MSQIDRILLLTIEELVYGIDEALSRLKDYKQRSRAQ